MKILKKDEKILLLNLNYSLYERNGFLEEIDMKDIPPKIQEKLKVTGGAGTAYKEYFKSNTAGETAGKYFVQIADRIKFELKNVEILKGINNEISFEKGIEIIIKALERENLNFKLSYYFNDNYKDDPEKNHINYVFKLIVDKTDYIHLNHPFEDCEDFEEYKKFFFGRDKALIDFSLDVPCEYNVFEKILKNPEKTNKLEKMTKKDFTINDIEVFLKQFKAQNMKWYFAMHENKTFYGNA